MLDIFLGSEDTVVIETKLQVCRGIHIVGEESEKKKKNPQTIHLFMYLYIYTCLYLFIYLFICHFK